MIKVFGACQTQVGYVVFVCSSCGRYLAAKSGQKSRRCNYCGAVIDLWRAKKLTDAASAREASRLVRELKMRPEE